MILLLVDCVYCLLLFKGTFLYMFAFVPCLVVVSFFFVSLGFLVAVCLSLRYIMFFV